MALRATPTETNSLGYFRIFARPPGGKRREITIFRSAPVMVSSCSFADPFSDQTAQLSLLQITPFDNPGHGDLDWLVPDSDIDIVFQNTGSADYEWSWEGYIASYSLSISGTDISYTLDLKGAFYGLDDYLAIPSYPKRPIPYENLIAQAFNQGKHPTHLGQFRIVWPEWWDLRVPEFEDPKYLNFLKPWGVSTGQVWTGFTTRSTGTWEPVLTGHVQSMLSVMFADGGAQWSIRNRGRRRPELFLREIPDTLDPDIIEVQIGAPGVAFSLTRDYTQRASVIYGQGVDDAGISYSGMEVTPDGRTTYYKPFAASPLVYPRKNNPLYDKTAKPKEVMIRFQDGVDQLSAQKIAQGQFQRFAEPGLTGSIVITTDMRYADGRLCPRMLVKAGITIRILGLFGVPEGVLAHVTHVSLDFNALTLSMEFDTKYRDQLTVDEVKARTRDALTPLRALQVGKYTNTVNDLLLPWSYREGSGCVPEGSKEFFLEKLPDTATFPYEEWTTKYPPKRASSRSYYIRINPTDTDDATNNWSGVRRDGNMVMSIPIRMSQAGTIRLSQIAAYDKDGHVLPVRFHFSVYSGNSVAPDSMPKFPVDPEAVPEEIRWLRPLNIETSYEAGQPNPFFEDAWEQYKQDGTQHSDDSHQTAANAGLIVGWGNYFEAAGYSPGRSSRGASRTGMLEDTTPWSWSQGTDVIDPQTTEQLEEYAGMLFVQIYCDEQGTEPDDAVYFLGRFFRQEPGTQ